MSTLQAPSVLGRSTAGMLACAFACASPAQAGTVTADGGTVRFAAAPGEANRVVLGRSAHTEALVIQDDDHPVRLATPLSASATAGAIYCQEVGDAVHCRSLLDGRYLDVEVALGDRDDRLVSRYPTLMVAEGGPGADAMTVEGPSWHPYLVGGDGDDRFDTSGMRPWAAEGWSATVLGNAGDDFVRGHADGLHTFLTYVPGPGADTASVTGSGGFRWHYDAPSGLSAHGDAPRTQGVQVTMDGLANDGAPGEGDNVPVTVQELRGTEAADDMEAGRGGGFQAPSVHGLGGDDRLFTRDGVANIAYCGDGDDVAIGDAGEGWRDCESFGVG